MASLLYPKDILELASVFGSLVEVVELVTTPKNK